MALVSLSVSHHTAPVEAREQLAVPDADIASRLPQVLRAEGIDEVVLLSTCNRVEWVASGADAARCAQALRAGVQDAWFVSSAWLDKYAQIRRDEDAIRHLFRVSSSLDSLIVGEAQILGQVKRAFEVSRSAGCAGAVLQRLFHHAFRTAKRVRSETRIAENAVSISFAAVELAKKVFGRLEGKQPLVIGAGKMGTLALRHLMQAGANAPLLVNRSHERAQAAAASLGGRALPWGELASALVQADIVISCTGSQHYVVTPEIMRAVVSKRRFRPLFLVDIAVPRDVDPACGDIEPCYVFDVDDLGRVVASNLEARKAEARRALSIVEDEVIAFRQWMETNHVVPTIVQLRTKIERIKEEELERCLRQHPELAPEHRDAMMRLAHTLVRKILHEPTVQLRASSSQDESMALVSAARELFNLDTPEGSRELGAEALVLDAPDPDNLH